MKGRSVKAAGKCLVVGILFLLLGTGCRLGYYLHLAAGQWSLLSSAVPVEDALREGSLSPEERERLQLVARIKDFGERELGLKRTENYETVSLESRPTPLYTIAASPRDRLSRITWWFPLVGDMPYLGFFDRESATKEKEKLVGKDLDVILSRADAYSTLGWFKDPVTRNLLGGTTLELAEIILHEMTHTTLYVKGQGEFNEGLAMLVGLVGAQLFMEGNFGPSHPLALEAGETLHDERLFSFFLATLVNRLERLYNSAASYEEKVSEREKVFAGGLDDFDRLRPRLKTDRYRAFGNAGINNAYLLSLSLYHRRFALFEAYLTSQGGSVKAMLQALERLAGEEGDLLSGMR